MTREFVYMDAFQKRWTKLGLNDNDLAELENYLLKNPDAGAVIQDTGGLRKMRWALPNKGKSGSIRVLYIDFVIDETMYMIDLFTKNEKQNLSMSEKNSIKQFIKNNLKLDE